jgi:hypothetical protein
MDMKLHAFTGACGWAVSCFIRFKLTEKIPEPAEIHANDSKQYHEKIFVQSPVNISVCFQSGLCHSHDNIFGSNFV